MPVPCRTGDRCVAVATLVIACLALFSGGREIKSWCDVVQLAGGEEELDRTHAIPLDSPVGGATLPRDDSLFAARITFVFNLGD